MSEVAIGARTFVDETLARFSNEAVEAAMTTDVYRLRRFEERRVAARLSRQGDLAKFYGRIFTRRPCQRSSLLSKPLDTRGNASRSLDSLTSSLAPLFQVAAQQAVAADGAAPAAERQGVGRRMKRRVICSMLRPRGHVGGCARLRGTSKGSRSRRIALAISFILPAVFVETLSD